MYDKKSSLVCAMPAKLYYPQLTNVYEVMFDEKKHIVTVRPSNLQHRVNHMVIPNGEDLK